MQRKSTHTLVNKTIDDEVVISKTNDNGYYGCDDDLVVRENMIDISRKLKDIKVPEFDTFRIDDLLITATSKFSESLETSEGHFPQISALVMGDEAKDRAIDEG